MGFFSWKTMDTDKSICNEYQDVHETFTVYMRDNKGNVWEEKNYDGYGVFGGKDYYELLAEMNGLDSDRSMGINLAFKNTPNGKNPNCLHPSLNESKKAKWDGTIPECCEHQGFFYDLSEVEDENW